MTLATPDADQLRAAVPRWRGWLHMGCFYLAIPAGVVVVASAVTPLARGAAVVYALALCALFGVSGSYHRGRWSPVVRVRMKRADHATIFVMIAGSYTPICLLALSPGAGRLLLGVAWLGALTGVALSVTGIAERRYVGLACYISLGWVSVVAMPGLARHLSVTGLTLLVAGGLIYTVGGVVLGLRRPDPFPRTFGYHEVWHTMVVAAAACHYVMILELVRAAT